jgi:hypothetical protein
MNMKNTVQTELLQRIVRYLMLHACFTDNIGLLNGKTGIAIFFYHYARYIGKQVYDDFAGELIDEIYKEIHINTLLNFRDGLCGIAWGIDYLIRNDFLEGNPDEVLEDLDKRIMEWDVRRISDYSLETGLEGIACYVVSRMENREKEQGVICQDYVCDLIEALKENKKETNPVLMNALKPIAAKFDSRHCEERSDEANQPHSIYNPVFEIIDKTKFNAKKIFETQRSFGIDRTGYAGIGLKLMEIGK